MVGVCEQSSGMIVMNGNGRGNLMKRVLTFVVALGWVSAWTPEAWAFLGDDFAAIEAHYGAALSRSQLVPGLEMSVHESTGYRILVLYRDGKSNRETFAKLSGPGSFTEQEIGAFLLAHAAGEKWQDQSAVTGARLWGRQSAVASYVDDGSKSTLSFEKSGGGVVVSAAGPAGPEAAEKTRDTTLSTGVLDIGKLEIGKVQTGKLQTGPLSLGHLEPAK